MEMYLNNNKCYVVEMEYLYNIYEYEILKETKNTYVIAKPKKWWVGEYHVKKNVMRFDGENPKMLFLTLEDATEFRKTILKEKMKTNNNLFDEIKRYNAEIEVELQKLEVE